jgi:glucosylglycerol-phosphate synthase
MSTRRRSFVTVYHRAPYDEDVLGDMTQCSEHPSPNGIIPTLRSVFAGERSGVWVAWTRAELAGAPGFAPDVTVGPRGSRIDVHRVPLSAREVDDFYHRFSKEALWPIICSSPANARFDDDRWRTFVGVNTRFADVVAQLAEPDASVWVHDYNLWLVPGLLRARMPRARIGFFHHTPFPAADVFAILPWREAIARSLLACDLVGFHIPHYANNFATAVTNLCGSRATRSGPVSGRFVRAGTPLSAPRMVEEVEHGGRRIELGAFPVGIDCARIDAIRATAEHARRVAAIRRELGDTQVLLAVDRLDYVKGSVEKLRAYERLLEEHPRHRETTTFVNVVTPPADAISVHRSVRDEIDSLVGRINGRFSTLSWTPVRYFYRPLSFPRVVSWYEAASVAWISPLRDGLNLVAKEFVAAAGAGPKVLVLSEFAGAHVELKHAVAVNPYALQAMADALHAALDMPAGARRRRMAAMNRIVRAQPPHGWAADFLDRLEAAPGPIDPERPQSNAAGQLSQRSMSSAIGFISSTQKR